MSQLSLLPVVSVVNGQPVASSLEVATYFDIRHDHVLRDIRNLLKSEEPNAVSLPKSGEPNAVSLLKSEQPNAVSLLKSGQPNGFLASSFFMSEYMNRGKSYPMYLMTKNGFTLLAFGFRTPRAREFQIAYINAFDAMAERLSRLNDAETLARGRLEAATHLVGSRAALADVALALLDEGLTQRQAAKLLHVSRHVVYRLKKRFAFLSSGNAREVQA